MLNFKSSSKTKPRHRRPPFLTTIPSDGAMMNSKRRLQRNLPEHLAGLLASLDIDEEILQEHLRCCLRNLSVDGLVISHNVDLLIDDGPRGTYRHGLAVGSGDSLALRSGCHNDQSEVSLLSWRVRQLEMEVGGGQREVSLARGINSSKHRWSRESRATCLDNPEVQPRIEVRPRNLTRRAEN